MTIQQIIVWIIIGGVAGWLADLAVSGIRLGLIGAIIAGIIGGFLGGWLFGLLNINLGDGIIFDVLKSFIGAVILLIILRLIRRK